MRLHAVPTQDKMPRKDWEAKLWIPTNLSGFEPSAREQTFKTFSINKLMIYCQTFPNEYVYMYISYVYTLINFFFSGVRACMHFISFPAFPDWYE